MLPRRRPLLPPVPAKRSRLRRALTVGIASRSERAPRPPCALPGLVLARPRGLDLKKYVPCSNGPYVLAAAPAWSPPPISLYESTNSRRAPLAVREAVAGSARASREAIASISFGRGVEAAGSRPGLAVRFAAQAGARGRGTAGLGTPEGLLGRGPASARGFGARRGASGAR